MYSKGQFFSNTVYLERGMPYFAFVDTNAVLVKKKQTDFRETKNKAPLCKGSSRLSRVRNCFVEKYYFYNPSVLPRKPPPLTQGRLLC